MIVFNLFWKFTVDLWINGITTRIISSDNADYY